MDADRFSLKARRTTRIPLRIPVLVVTEEGGNSRTLDGWTMIVNIHGAKIECKHPLTLHQEVRIEVPFNGMSQDGKVVWSRSDPNESGAYEFGVELDQPENLWGVGFPPSDWNPARGTKDEAATAAVLDLAPTEVALQSIPRGHSGLDEGQTEIPTGNPEASPASDDSSAPQHPPQLLDLSSELSTWNAEGNVPPPQGATTEFSEIQMSTLEEEIPMSDVERYTEGEAEQPPSSPITPCEAEQVEPASLVPGAPATPSPSTLPGSLAQLNPTDKLSAFFNELVDSALQARLLGLIEGVGKRIEERVTDIESSAVSRIEEQICGTAQTQCDALEQRTLAIVAAQQQALEQNVRNYLAEAEGAARRRQQSQFDQDKQAMGEEMAALLQTNKQSMEQLANELLSVTQLGLRSSMEQQLPGIEKDLLDRCRTQGERMMAAQVEQWVLLFSDRVQNAQQSMQQRLDEALNEANARQVAEMESRLTELQSQAGSQLEQQLHRIGTQIRQTFLRHMVTELSRSQQVWIQQAQRQLDMLASENLEKTRRNLSQYMKSFGEFLIQQAAGTEQAGTAAAEMQDTQAQLPLMEIPVEVSSENQS